MQRRPATARGLPADLRAMIAAVEAEQAAYPADLLIRSPSARSPAAYPATWPPRGLGALSAYGADYLINRMAQYGARGRAPFFQAAEQYDGESTGYGWIVRYIARDDDRTCGPCSEAQGYYCPAPARTPAKSV